MPQMLQRPADADSTDVQTGQQITVQHRFHGLSAGQELEVVETDGVTADGAYPEALTLELQGPTTGTIATSAMTYHGEDIERAVDAGALELQ
ncbi:MAG: hypothetical protein ABEI77_09845 [Halorientalis sp.]